ncbi:hypothetical protein MXAN_2192 [Myxococcus xanthus DK 1622]|uniref:Uncharacterized protein n=1 Tax=Myxococcus xanthus (strain DK1622) TaxID=246197 RepID=Q1DAA7_MYXXD|nr:hypothetical protein MXAN_2192 [Myxococcus xanthus DK 1622]
MGHHAEGHGARAHDEVGHDPRPHAAVETAPRRDMGPPIAWFKGPSGNVLSVLQVK